MKIIKKIFKFLIIIIFLPFYWLGKVLGSKKRKLIKIIIVPSLVLIILPAYYGLLILISLGNFLGYPTEVIGDSMLPGIKSHEYVKMYTYPGLASFRTLNKGDIVVFADVKEGNSNKDFIKRVIALPRDVFEIRDQLVYVNNRVIDEPYIYKPKSTYGGKTLRECEKYVVPEKNILVLGDNRKLSNDSREFGFISINDISKTLPLKEQSSFREKWRNANDDNNDFLKSNNEINRYLDLLNKIRESKKLKPLKLNDKLSKSAELRAKIILETDDFSFEATKSGYTMSKSMSDAGYLNVIYGEFPLLGYYTAEELIAYEKEFSKVLDFFLDKEAQDIGLSSYTGLLNNCSTNIIVQHVAGYRPPNYNAEDLESWKMLLSRLREILPSWEKIKEYPLTYNNNKKDADRLLEIINYRIIMIQKIVTKMENKQWLNNEENGYIKQNLSFNNEQENLSKKFNSFRWQL